MKVLLNNLACKMSVKMLVLLAIACASIQQANAQDVKPAMVSAVTSLDKSSDLKTNADFPGGMDKFYTYISSQLALDSTCNPGKKLYVNFTVDKEGKLRRVKVNGHVLSDKMNDRLVKIFESSPQWIAAEQNGRKVKTHFVCPVTFMNKDDMMAMNTPVKN